LTVFFFFPKSQILLEELDDALGVTEFVLLEFVNLLEGLLKSIVSEVDCLGGVLHSFVVEYGEVESETEFDWAAGREIDRHSFLVCIKGLVSNLSEMGVFRGLCHVAVVVSDHFDEEALGLSVGASF